MFHFAFFLREYKNNTDKEYLQKFYDYFFRQIELSLREIGYGDVSINKKMKDYINIFYSILDKINNWNSLDNVKKGEILAFYYKLKGNDLKIVNALFITTTNNPNAFFSLRNIKNITVIDHREINPFILMKHDNVVIDSNVLEQIKQATIL